MRQHQHLTIFSRRKWVFIAVAILGFTTTVAPYLQAAPQQQHVVQIADVVNADILNVTSRLRYSVNDSLAFAEPSYDDSHWRAVGGDPHKPNMEIKGWNRVGWFRLTLVEPDSAQLSALALRCYSLGTLETYVDGKLISTIGSADGTHQQSASNILIPLSVHFSDSTSVHHIAFRVRTHVQTLLGAPKYSVPFGVVIGKTEVMYAKGVEDRFQLMRLFMLPLGMVVALGILHLLLWLFDRTTHVNLWYVAFATCFASILFCWIIQTTSENSQWVIASYNAVGFLWTLVIAVAVLLITKIFYGTISTNRVAIVCTAAAVVVFTPMLIDVPGTILWGCFASIAAIDVGRLTFGALRNKQPGSWILGAGFLLFLGYILTWFFVEYLDWVDLDIAIWRVIVNIGLVSMPLSMSVFMAFRVTKTNRELKVNLEAVESLTAEKIKRERSAVEAELARHQLIKENERKSKELEEARKLQFSMLPTSMPNNEHIRASIAMNTATEVGGDYLDYYVHSASEYTFAIGDATGHGLKAGVMVATTKSHFQARVSDSSHAETLKYTNEGIMRLHLRGMYMCLALLTIRGQKAVWTSSGIPPLLHLHSTDGTVSEYLVKGLPLGAPKTSPADSITFDVQPGDVLLAFTDGLPELFNEQLQSLGIDRVKRCLADEGSSDPPQLLDAIIRQCDEWRGERSYDDDVTMLAIKIP